jgi:23S rRNA pseudouridine1911/1915/1917 synthase
MSSSEEIISLEKTIPAEYSGMRFDAALSLMFPEYSRSQLSKWIKLEQITLNGHNAKIKQKVKGYELVHLQCELIPQTLLKPQNLELEIHYEDEHLLVLNKHANWVVHPGAGNPDNTIVNALLYYHPELENLPRAGIIHRLDKDTTGLLIVAKTLESYYLLSKLMQERGIQRYYQAVVYGELTGSQTIETLMGRHPTSRTRMAVTKSGKRAVSHIKKIKAYKGSTHVQVKLETGRTHQIRVHLTHINHPLIGDQTYKNKNTQKISETILQHSFADFTRQALHAYQLEFIHPITQTFISLQQPLPEDMQALLNKLEELSYQNEEGSDFN